MVAMRSALFALITVAGGVLVCDAYSVGGTKPSSPSPDIIGSIDQRRAKELNKVASSFLWENIECPPTTSLPLDAVRPAPIVDEEPCEVFGGEYRLSRAEVDLLDLAAMPRELPLLPGSKWCEEVGDGAEPAKRRGWLWRVVFRHARRALEKPRAKIKAKGRGGAGGRFSALPIGPF